MIEEKEQNSDKKNKRSDKKNHVYLLLSLCWTAWCLLWVGRERRLQLGGEISVKDNESNVTATNRLHHILMSLSASNSRLARSSSSCNTMTMYGSRAGPGAVQTRWQADYCVMSNPQSPNDRFDDYRWRNFCGVIHQDSARVKSRRFSRSPRSIRDVTPREKRPLAVARLYGCPLSVSRPWRLPKHSR